MNRFASRYVAGFAALLVGASAAAVGIAATPALATGGGLATATAVQTNLSIAVPLLGSIGVTGSMATASAPPNATANTVAPVQAALGAVLGNAFDIVNAGAVDSTASVSGTQAVGTTALTNVVVAVPGLTGANALLTATAVSATATCPGDLTQTTAATASLPATVQVAGQTITPNLTSGNTVTVGLPGLASSTVTLAFSQTATLSGSSASTAVVVSVNIDALGIASTTGQITLATASCTRPSPIAPTVTSISPASGPTTGLGSAVVHGSQLTGATSVTIGGQPATITSIPDANDVDITVPAGTAGAADVSVTTPNGAATLTHGYTYVAVPQLTGVLPNAGPAAGGTLVSITGTNLSGATGVTFGGTPASSVVVSSSLLILATAPAHAGGTVDVAVTTGGGTATLAGSFTYQSPPPSILTILPASGPTTGGTQVAITGLHLAGTTAVTIAGHSAAFTVVNDALISVATPAGTPGGADVAVTTSAGSTTRTSGFTYVLPAPAISAVTPNSGPTSGGTTITITGSGFTGTSAVLIGLLPATAVRVDSDTSVSATVPAGVAVGSVNVTVVAAGGTTTATGGFTYTLVVPPLAVSAVSPAEGALSGGQLVTITGTGLSGVTGVSFGANPAPAPVVVLGDNVILVTTPAGSVAGPVNVMVTTGATSATLTNGYTYDPAPSLGSAVITGLSPSVGPVTGLTPEIISGSGFTGATAVTIGGTSVAFIDVSDTEITTLTPTHAAGAVAVSVTALGGAVTTLAGAFTYQSLIVLPAGPSLSSVTPSSVLVGATVPVTLTGANFTGVLSVSFGLVPGTNVTLVNDGDITVDAPVSLVPGTVGVTVSTPYGVVTLPASFSYLAVALPVLPAAPTVSALTPTGGPVAGGTIVTLVGAALDGALAVTVGGATATIRSDSATSISVTVPPGIAGPADVEVTGPGGLVLLAAAYSYLAIPVVTAVTPSSGPLAGGTAISLTGTGFTNGVTSVMVGPNPASSISVTSPTTMTVMTPPGAVGPAAVVVDTIVGDSALASNFTYLAAAGAKLPAPLVWNRVAGKDRMATAVQISRWAYPTSLSASAVVLARADIFPDALVGGPFAAAKNAPILLTDTDSLVPDTAAEITRVLAPGGTVYLLGGTAALGPQVEKSLESMGFRTVRVAGANRFGTATAIAAALGDPTTVFEADGLTYADALSSDTAAAELHGAVLLTNGSTQSAETAAYKSAHPGTWYAVGGSAAAADPGVAPIVGTDRFATSTLVASRFFPNPRVVGFASGENFPDAMVASAILGRWGEPLLLAPSTGDTPPAENSYVQQHVDTVTSLMVFGGTSAVADQVLTDVPTS